MEKTCLKALFLERIFNLGCFPGCQREDLFKVLVPGIQCHKTHKRQPYYVVLCVLCFAACNREYFNQIHICALQFYVIAY